MRARAKKSMVSPGKLRKAANVPRDEPNSQARCQVAAGRPTGGMLLTHGTSGRGEDIIGAAANKPYGSYHEH